ncbi:MAG TPA: hypothetical protein VFC54_02780 [Pseudolabrys sp.]|nr:hypothetical protein [Pseudolabrys sp.]
MTDQTTLPPDTHASMPPRRPRSRYAIGTGVLVAVLGLGAFGGIAGARLMHRWEPHPVMLLQPSAIGQLKPDTTAAVKGSVAEVFGSKFIVQDDSGRALVDTGPQGDRGHVVDMGEAVTVQGRFDRGVMHAQLVVHADGKAQGFGPPNPPHPRHGPPPHDGPADRGLPPPNGGPANAPPQ